MNKLRTWAEALLQRPSYAAGFALLCTILPLTEWVAWSWLVLTQLRYGPRYSVLVLAAISLGVMILIGMLNGMWEIALVHIALLAVPVWIFSIVLRTSVSLNFTTQVIAITVLVALFLAGLAGLNDPAVVAGFLESRLGQLIEADPTFTQTIESFAQFFVLYWAAALFWSYLFSLFIGRWWQAALDNPGGFKREFHALRLNYLVGGGALVLILLSFWAPENTVVVAASILAASALTVAGLGLVHFYVQSKQWSNWVLVGVYLSVFLLSPFVVPLLVMFAAIDSAADLRKRLS